MFVIIKRMILWLLWLCKSFTINSDIFLWGSGVDGKIEKEKSLYHYADSGTFAASSQGRCVLSLTLRSEKASYQLDGRKPM